MSYRALKARYKGKTREAINKAIRAECPGGDEALDGLNDWHKVCEHRGWQGADGRGEESLQVTAYRHLLEIVDAMEDSVRARYSLPEREDREDLSRR